VDDVDMMHELLDALDWAEAEAQRRARKAADS
jgi:hypothetical protein